MQKLNRKSDPLKASSPRDEPADLPAAHAAYGTEEFLLLCQYSMLSTHLRILSNLSGTIHKPNTKHKVYVFACKGKHSFKVQNIKVLWIHRNYGPWCQKLQMLWVWSVSFQKRIIPKVLLFVFVCQSLALWAEVEHRKAFPCVGHSGLENFPEGSKLKKQQRSVQQASSLAPCKQGAEGSRLKKNIPPRKIVEGRFWNSGLSIFHFALSTMKFLRIYMLWGNSRMKTLLCVQVSCSCSS